MTIRLPVRSLLGGLLVAASLIGSVTPVEAALARLKFTPPYGTPFPDLEWSGEAVVDDHNCPGFGLTPTLNFGGGSCSGQFSFVSASITLQTIYPGPPATVGAPSETINFLPSQFGQVAAVQRTSTDPDDWTGLYSSAFKAVQAPLVPAAEYGGEPAYFSLIFVGSFAQLIWFRDDPGNPLFTSKIPIFEKSLEYLGCYLTGSGEHSLSLPFIGELNKCGLSDANNAKGASLSISVVPEPEAYMLALASLGVLGAARFASRRRESKT